MTEIGKDLAKELLGILQSTKAFALEQAPDVLQQLVQWEYVTSLVYLIIGVVFMLAVVFGAPKALSYFSKKFDETKEDGYCVLCVFTCIVSAALFIAGVVLFFTDLDSFLKVCLAPKVFLIEYLSKLVK